MNFIPVNDTEKKQMLERIGVRDSSELFSPIPASVKVDALRLPQGVSEQELIAEFESVSKKNVSLKELTCFKGAGCYEHFIPSLVGEIIGRSEFSTAYTPYQAEASQGTLQAIFEYQSLIVALTGLDISNASLYDGASAVAEAALLAMRVTGRKRILMAKTVHPEYRAVTETYLQGSGAEIAVLENIHGEALIKEIKGLVSDQVAGLVVQSPNFLGNIEDLEAIGKYAAAAGALFITVVNPLSLGTLKTPGEVGADIAVGEGQILGNAAGLGGFSFGFMACTKALAWKMPGRIVGQTTDRSGKRGYVLTLQSREQHIRREKATSNICTNSALNALAGCVYLSGWGSEGLQKLAELNIIRSHYAYKEITRLAGYAPVFPDRNFFNEFLIRTTRDIKKIREKLLTNNILGPFEPGIWYPEFKDCLLFCVTESRSKKDIDRLVAVLEQC